mmetsp:Transcript_43554/g.86568  ORF Transcript_43554/g.86568 Transcript_43554/m.86568 type:complete len:274 (-) Transcript_43554:294-1115(-)
MSYPLLSTVFNRAQDDIWQMLNLRDILTLSTCCKFTSHLGITSETIHKMLQDGSCGSKIGNFSVKFPDELTTGLFRRILCRLNTGVEAHVAVDIKTGRVILDIGSAFLTNDAYEAPQVHAVSDEDSDAENQQIFKELELCSYDEYDDFNPRHPKPRDRAHRRGDSYFNSDIDMVVNELYSGLGAAPFDMKNVAASMNDVPTPPPKAAAGGDLKSRLLAKKKAAAEAAGGAGATGPPLAPPLAPPRPSSPGCVTRLPYQLRASAELNCDSDEDK